MARRWLTVFCLTAALAFDCAGPAPISALTAQTSVAEFTRHSDIIYGRKYGVALTLERFAPARSDGLGVVWVVSSNGRSSREQTLQPSFEQRISPLIARGYTVFAVIHGSAPAFHLQDYEQDVRRAVRFVRNHASDFGIDAQRIGIAGSSAGGLIALMVAMRARDGDPKAEDLVDRESDRVQAVGCFFPPTDLMNFGETSQNILDMLQQRGGVVDPTFQFYEIDRKTGARVFVTERQRVLQLLHDASPVTQVSTDDPPTILIHGDQDQAVPLQQSRRLIDRLTAEKVAARLVVREGKGHAWPGWESDSMLIAEWLDAHLRR